MNRAELLKRSVGAALFPVALARAAVAAPPPVIAEPWLMVPNALTWSTAPPTIEIDHFIEVWTVPE